MSDGQFKALILEEAGGKVSSSIRELTDADLPANGEVTVRVGYSTINYKDGLILNGLGKLVRTYPHVPGVDFAGTQVEWLVATRSVRARQGQLTSGHGRTWRQPFMNGANRSKSPSLVTRVIPASRQEAASSASLRSDGLS